MLNWLKKTASVTAKPIAPKHDTHGSHQAANDAAPAKSHSHAGPNYDASLIDGYLATHRTILDLFGKIKEAAEQNRWQTVSARLAEFQVTFNGHRANESVRLYTYLLAESGDDVEQMKHFSKEMHDIGKTVALFLYDQHDIAESPAKQSTFLDSWMGIGHVLGKRVSNEEKTLYPMYQHGQ